MQYPVSAAPSPTASLLHLNVHSIAKKDIQREIRARKDLQAFVAEEDPAILLDCAADSAESIVDTFLGHLQGQGHLSIEGVNQVREVLLTDEPIPQFTNLLRSTDEGSWAVITAEATGLRERTIGFVQLRHPVDLGGSSGVESLLFFVLTPCGLEKTHNASDTGRTFASLLMDPDLRLDLTQASHTADVATAITRAMDRDFMWAPEEERELNQPLRWNKWPGGNIWEDLARRLPWYPSDYWDGIRSIRAITKTLATIAFLYFACILPAIAYGVLNERYTDGNIDVKKMIWSQAISGTIFALFGGQPMVILLSTAPLALYMKVIYEISESSGIEFWSLFAWVGLWNGLFLVFYGISGSSVLMRYSTRFVEETFGFFISIAFSHDAIRPMVENFVDNFYSCGRSCNREESLLFFLLLFGTALVGYHLWAFRSSSLLHPYIREFFSDYSLPISVALLSLLGSGVFRPVDDSPFPYTNQNPFRISFLFDIPVWGVFVALGLGFLLSLLFYVDGNISTAMANSAENRLRKGHAYHMDMYIVGVIIIGLSLVGLPWLNPALPHSPLHVRQLAERETVFLPNGAVVERIVRVHETRLSALIAHILIGISVLMVPTPLQEIPVPVLYGVFLYLAVTALPGSQLWQRILLLITERRQYPPHNFVRRVPGYVMHAFTLVQLLCVGMLCVFGFTPVDYVQMFLPLPIIALIPIRTLILPRLFPKRYLDTLDPKLYEQN